MSMSKSKIVKVGYFNEDGVKLIEGTIDCQNNVVLSFVDQYGNVIATYTVEALKAIIKQHES